MPLKGIKQRIIRHLGFKHVADKAGAAVTNQASVRELARLDASPASIADYAHFWRVANWQPLEIAQVFSGRLHDGDDLHRILLLQNFSRGRP